ncbi:MAG: branched-chain amino acid ABC transporter permease [Deltaproteobacteria bacterium]|nr:branched-chain amino acid ABC transporter permease [Deltaproteobacteria bacterium]MBI3293130.1 branched-chain amino acid ABC transporter permease [Deltaproteobacteria bacterium]
MHAFIQNLINGLAAGSVYALVALGYTMVYGVLQFINFAHSDIFMLGAFGGLYLASWLAGVHPQPLQLALIMIGTMAFCVIVALTVERIAYRPLRNAPRLNVLITAIGVSLFLENLSQVVFGADPQLFPSIIKTVPLLEGDDIILNNIQVLVVGVSLFLMLILHWIVHHTKLGTAMRAVSFDIQIASLMGIPTDLVIAFTFVIGSSLAGSAAILYGLSYPKIEPFLGVMIGLKAFVAAVFGGIGSIMGAAVGGIVLGLAEVFTVYYISSSFRDAIAFAILIVILLVRPQGLLGSVRKVKV